MFYRLVVIGIVAAALATSASATRRDLPQALVGLDYCNTDCHGGPQLIRDAADPTLEREQMFAMHASELTSLGLGYLTDMRDAGFADVTIRFQPHGPNSPQPWTSGGTGRLAVLGPGSELFVCRPDGSAARTIARGAIARPVWSQHGDLIAFGGASLVASRPDGSRRMLVLATGASNPAFSPDEQSFYSYKGDPPWPGRIRFVPIAELRP